MPDLSDRQSADETTARDSLEAQRALELLNEQAESMHAELAQLREKLKNVQQEMTAERSLQLQEANEKLLLAAEHAESIADAAVGSLGKLARSLPQRRESARADLSQEMQHLREANEQLVLGALTSREIQEKAEAKHLRQVKFIAMVAHELRNPLNPIRNAAGLLKRVRNDQAMLESLQGIIERQVVHMARLIDDLLDGARADLGKLRLQFATVNLPDVLGVAVDACRPTFEVRRQHFSLHLPPGPLSVVADQFRLAQIFSNLLDNASKYTPQGGNISLELATEEHSVVVTVADDGIGLAPNALPRIFDLLVQDERALALQGRGLGIGLAVVRELVEAHGGSVTATSAGEDQGSQFVVRLPNRIKAD